MLNILKYWSISMTNIPICTSPKHFSYYTFWFLYCANNLPFYRGGKDVCEYLRNSYRTGAEERSCAWAFRSVSFTLWLILASSITISLWEYLSFLSIKCVLVCKPVVKFFLCESIYLSCQLSAYLFISLFESYFSEYVSDKSTKCVLVCKPVLKLFLFGWLSSSASASVFPH